MWKNWLIGTAVCLAFIAFRISGPVSPDAMGQVLLAGAIIVIWFAVTAVRWMLSRDKHVDADSAHP